MARSVTRCRWVSVAFGQGPVAGVYGKDADQVGAQIWAEDV